MVREQQARTNARVAKNSFLTGILNDLRKICERVELAFLINCCPVYLAFGAV
jgi:hypothetical protein